MINLNYRKSDYISLENQHENAVETLKVIVIYPKTLGEFDANCQYGELNIPEGNITKVVSSDIDDQNGTIGIIASKIKEK